MFGTYVKQAQIGQIRRELAHSALEDRRGMCGSFVSKFYKVQSNYNLDNVVEYLDVLCFIFKNLAHVLFVIVQHPARIICRLL
jgi:hypothetical protein